MHEIITIQIGRQANYVGTHFWNAQGQGPDGSPTYLPRTLIYDLRGGFGSLATVNALGADVEEIEGDESAWSGALARLQTAAVEPSPFLKSLVAMEPPVFPTAATTRYFSDFAQTFYHPRSLIPITPAHPVLDPSSQTSTNDLPSFNTHADGSALFESIDAAHDVYDRDLRPWVEECDSMQAIQLLTSSDDAWAGFASAYVEEIRDQLGKGSVWIWGTDGLEKREQSAATRRLKALNHSLSLVAFNAHASLYVPMALPQPLDPSVQLDPHVLWHTSALASAVFESATLPVRLRAEDDRRVPLLGDWEDALGDGGRRRVAEVATEAGGSTDADTRGMTNGHHVNNDRQTTNGSAQTDARLTDTPLPGDEADEQDAANRSLPVDLFQPPSSLPRAARTFRPRTFARVDVFRGREWTVPPSYEGAMEQDLRFMRRGRPVVETYQSDAPLLPLVATFPHIFTNSAPPSKTDVPGMRIRTSLRTSSSIANWIRGVETLVHRMPAGLLGDVMGGEEKESVRNELRSMAEAYVGGWDSADEDSDDDE